MAIWSMATFEVGEAESEISPRATAGRFLSGTRRLGIYIYLGISHYCTCLLGCNIVANKYANNQLLLRQMASSSLHSSRFCTFHAGTEA